VEGLFCNVLNRFQETEHWKDDEVGTAAGYKLKTCYFILAVIVMIVRHLI
jgi:hypothetical protein